MPEKLLSDRSSQAAKPKDRIYYKNDGGGLRLQVRPDGSRYWMLRYTWGSKESTHGLGAYPAVTLEEARGKAIAARKTIAAGQHPTTERKVRAAQAVAQADATFKIVAEEWLARNKPEWSSHHHERNLGLLNRILYQDLGDLPVTAITEPMLLKTLLKAYDGGTKESARRARAVAAQVFRHAKETHRAQHNPALELARSRLLKKPEVTHFAALKVAQVGPFLRKLAESQVEPVTRAGLLLMLYTGLRDAALRAGRWPEVDLRTGTWTVPAERMKSGREHVLPLPKQGVAVLRELAKITKTDDAAYIFASRGKAGYLAENTLRLAMHGLGFKVTAHGFRSLLTDLLNEQGFNADAVERQLDHVLKDKVRGSYLRSDFLPYRRTMMQWVADWADAQRNKQGAPSLPGNVLKFRQGG